MKSIFPAGALSASMSKAMLLEWLEVMVLRDGKVQGDDCDFRTGNKLGSRVPVFSWAVVQAPCSRPGVRKF
jgi:hypothetical protein